MVDGDRNGLGDVVLDLATGAAAYLVSGGLAGGGTCEGEVTVCVPHDRSGSGAVCVDQGALYDSTVCE